MIEDNVPVEENNIPTEPGIVSEAVPEPQEKPAEIDMEKAKTQLSPEEIAQVEAYCDNASLVIWSEKTQPAVLQELQGKQSPIKNIAATANHIHKRLFDGLAKTGEQMTDKTMFMGIVHVVSELNLLAEAAGIYVLSSKQRLDALQMTMMQYFKEGMETGKIDPVELQRTIEPLMNDEQRQYGLMALNKLGSRISKTPPPKGQNWTVPINKNRPPQPQPQPSAEVPAGVQPGLVGQGGM